MTIQNALYDGVACTQDLFAQMQASYLGDGYISGYEDELEVTQTDPVGMKVYVSTGRARIRGRWYEVEDTPYELSISSNTSGNPRIDRVIVRLETLAPYQISARILEGTPAASPTAPTLTTDGTGGIYEISLGQVLVASGASTITTSNITDERSDYSVCGIAGVKYYKYSEVTVAANIPMGGYKAVSVATPTAATDAANLTYFNSKLIGGVFGENKCIIVPWISNTIPTGWLECNGQSVSAVTYPNLFAAFGYTYGGSSGTFNLPDRSGVMALGATSSLGTVSGEAEHVLTSSEMPSHAHSGCGSAAFFTPGSQPGSDAISVTTYGNTASAGGDLGHNNLQPYIVFRFICYGS